MKLYQVDLQVGKTYRLVSGEFQGGYMEINPTFTVTDIDSDGDCWTRDCTWRGVPPYDEQGWCFTDTGIDLVFEEVVKHNKQHSEPLYSYPVHTYRAVGDNGK